MQCSAHHPDVTLDTLSTYHATGRSAAGGCCRRAGLPSTIQVRAAFTSAGLRLPGSTSEPPRRRRRSWQYPLARPAPRNCHRRSSGHAAAPYPAPAVAACRAGRHRDDIAAKGGPRAGHSGAARRCPVPLSAASRPLPPSCSRLAPVPASFAAARPCTQPRRPFSIPACPSAPGAPCRRPGSAPQPQDRAATGDRSRTLAPPRPLPLMPSERRCAANAAFALPVAGSSCSVPWKVSMRAAMSASSL